MSWATTISRSITTPNQSSRDGRKVNGWIIHHNAATGGAGVLELMRSGSKQVSANYQVMQGGEVVGVVPRENRSWSASNAAWDGASLTFEIANNSGAPGWTISEGAYVSVAKTIAEDSIWAGIPINRTTVRGHREGSAQGAGGSYSTACPGGIDLDRLVRMANEFKTGTAGLESTPITTDQGDIMARYLWAKNRSGILVKGETGGIYYPATPEEAQSLSTVYNGLDVDDRTWDVARQASLNILNAAGGTLSSVTGAIDKAFAEISKLIKDGSISADINVDDLAAKLAPLLAASGIEAKVDARALAEVFLNASVERLAS